MENNNKELPVVAENYTPGSVVAARLVWGLLGPCVFLCVLWPMSGNPAWMGLWEGVYVGNLVLIILSRYLEQRSGYATTLNEAPSTWKHFWRFTISLISIALIIWVGMKVGR